MRYCETKVTCPSHKSIWLSEFVSILHSLNSIFYFLKPFLQVLFCILFVSLTDKFLYIFYSFCLILETKHFPLNPRKQNGTVKDIWSIG